MEIIHQKTICDTAFQLLSNTANKYPKLYLKKLLAGLKGESNPSSKSVIISIIENIISYTEDSLITLW